MRVVVSGFSSGLGPDGHDLGGEVEDYQIVVGPGRSWTIGDRQFGRFRFGRLPGSRPAAGFHVDLVLR